MRRGEISEKANSTLCRESRLRGLTLPDASGIVFATGGAMRTRLLIVVLVCRAVAPLATRADDADVARGRGLYFRHCFDCHGPKARGDGPDAEYLARRPADLVAGGALDRYSDEEIVRFVREGRELRLEVRPGALRRHVKDSEAIYQFLRRLPSMDWEKVEGGEEIYFNRCTPCHDAYGRPQADLPEGVRRAPRDLSDPGFQKKVTDEELLAAIRHGRRGMPALVPPPGPEEARRLLPFVRLLSPGYALYDRFCLGCHGAYGEGAVGALGDALAPGFAFDGEFFRTKSAEEIRAGIWHMLREKSRRMPHFRDLLTEEEVKAILVYLRTLTPARRARFELR